MPGPALRAGQYSLGEIARRTGYESDVTLSKAFKRYFGVAPGFYREAAKLGYDPRPMLMDFDW